MATRYPGALDRDPNEIPDNIADSDTLDSPNHATIHNNVNGAVLQIEEKLGIGDTTASAGALLHGTAAGTSAWSADPSVVGSLSVAKDSAAAIFNLTAHHDTEATAAQLTLRKTEGSAASPSGPVDNNAVLGKIMFQGYDGNSYANGAQIIAQADGTPADGVMPTELIFKVTPASSETPVTAMTIKPRGETRFTADNDITTFAPNTGSSGDNPNGTVSLYNTDGAVDDFTCLDFIGNGTDAAARIGMKYTGSGSELHFGTSNSYGKGITHTGMMINPTGFVGIGTTLGDDMPSNDGTLSVKSTNAPVLAVYRVNSLAANVNSWFLSDYSSTGTIHCKIYNDGDIQNTGNSYGALSDERLKTVTAARDYYEDLRKLEVVNYQLTKKTEEVVTTDSDGEKTITYKIVDRDTPTIKYLGLVAQETEKHIAGLVKEGHDGMKELKYSVLTPMLLQAFQKLADKVEALEG